MIVVHSDTNQLSAVKKGKPDTQLGPPLQTFTRSKFNPWRSRMHEGEMYGLAEYIVHETCPQSQQCQT